VNIEFSVDCIILLGASLLESEGAHMDSEMLCESLSSWRVLRFSYGIFPRTPGLIWMFGIGIIQTLYQLDLIKKRTSQISGEKEKNTPQSWNH